MRTPPEVPLDPEERARFYRRNEAKLILWQSENMPHVFADESYQQRLRDAVEWAKEEDARRGEALSPSNDLGLGH